MTLADGGRWDYGYDALGQVTGGSRKFSDGTATLGQQFGYTFDSIGNRTQTVTNGRAASYTNNLLNQITTRAVPQVLDVLGTASPQAIVTVNDQPTQRQNNGYFYVGVDASNRSFAWPVTVNINAVVPGRSPAGTNVVSSQSGAVPLSRNPESFDYKLFDYKLQRDRSFVEKWLDRSR